MRGAALDITAAEAHRLVTDMLRNASSPLYEERALARLLPNVVEWCSEVERSDSSGE